MSNTTQVELKNNQMKYDKFLDIIEDKYNLDVTSTSRIIHASKETAIDLIVIRPLEYEIPRGNRNPCLKAKILQKNLNASDEMTTFEFNFNKTKDGFTIQQQRLRDVIKVYRVGSLSTESKSEVFADLLQSLLTDTEVAVDYVKSQLYNTVESLVLANLD